MALAVAGCTGTEPTPTPTPNATSDTGMATTAARALASGIAHGDVSAVAFSGTTGAEAEAQRRTVLAGMGATRPAVTVATVAVQGPRATATLGYTWTFPGLARPWTYQTKASLVDESGQWRTLWQPGVLQPGLDGSNRLSETRLQGARGKILGQRGAALVKLRPVLRIGIDKSQVSAATARASAARLARLVDVDRSAYVAKVAGAGARAFVEAIVFRADAPGRPSAAALRGIDGAESLDDRQMLASTREFARPVLGTVGTATGEIVTRSKGQVAAGDQVGRSGLQLRYDAQLRGTPGVTVRLVPRSAGGRPSASATPSPTTEPSSQPAPTSGSTVFHSRPVAGRDLPLTLDPKLQQLGERVLAHTASASALVAIRPSTGEVLAAANGPGSDDQSVATVGRFPPGSTFKVVSSLALLRSGLTPTSPVSCPATVDVNGKQFKNYSDYPTDQRGAIDLETALAQSCNTAFIGQRSRLSGTDLADAAATLGVGTDYDVGFPSFFGSVPADPSVTGRAAAMIGQGKVLASPLAMADVAASVSAGHTVVPELVVGTRATAKGKPLTATEARQLRQMMATVVSRGSGRVLRGVGGPTVIAKTGTAEFGPKAPYRTHAWMIAAQGDLAVAAFVAVGSSGSHTAGPLLASFLAGAR